MKESMYSVTMTEKELKLFSEFLEQKEYAARRFGGATSYGYNSAKAITHNLRNKTPMLSSGSAPVSRTVEENVAEALRNKRSLELARKHGLDAPTRKAKAAVLKFERKVKQGAEKVVKNTVNATKNVANSAASSVKTALGKFGNKAVRVALRH